jgi:glycosyltransferase involved in cell wall biosynthesis
MFTSKTSVIIPTRNREYLLLRLLKFFKKNKLKFSEILVIDSSDESSKKKVKLICSKYPVKLFHSKPSTSKQRNIGLAKRNKNNKYIFLLDDDIKFFKNTIKIINFYINKYRNDDLISGFSFNMIGVKPKQNFIDSIKTSRAFNFLNLYSSEPGKVMLSGWHTKILNLKENIFADWGTSNSIILKSKFVKKMRFAMNFGRYSYLEDLDFTITLNKKNKKIFIPYMAKVFNLKDIERNSFGFGIKEIFNRFLIVKKHKLNLYFFFIGSFLKLSNSFLSFLRGNYISLHRCLGNLVGIFKSFLSLLIN